MTHTLTNYGSETVPTWIYFSSSDAMLTAQSPNVSQSQVYRFNVATTVSSDSYTYTTNIAITVTPCNVNN